MEEEVYTQLTMASIEEIEIDDFMTFIVIWIVQQDMQTHKELRSDRHVIQGLRVHHNSSSHNILHYTPQQ